MASPKGKRGRLLPLSLSLSPSPVISPREIKGEWEVPSELVQLESRGGADVTWPPEPFSPPPRLLGIGALQPGRARASRGSSLSVAGPGGRVERRERERWLAGWFSGSFFFSRAPRASLPLPPPSPLLSPSPQQPTLQPAAPSSTRGYINPVIRTAL